MVCIPIAKHQGASDMELLDLLLSMDKQKGEWMDAIKIAMSDGRIDLTEHAPIFREYGVPTEYDNVLGPYLKIGLYDGYHWGDFGTKTAYFSDVKIWTGNDGYGTIMGGVPVSPLRHVAL